jgi:hypothetical protein
MYRGQILRVKSIANTQRSDQDEPLYAGKLTIRALNIPQQGLRSMNLDDLRVDEMPRLFRFLIVQYNS